MKKINNITTRTQKLNPVFRALWGFAKYQHAAFRCLVKPQSTDANMHAHLHDQFVFLIEEGDLGVGTFKRYTDHMNKNGKISSKHLMKIIGTMNSTTHYLIDDCKRGVFDV